MAKVGEGTAVPSASAGLPLAPAAGGRVGRRRPRRLSEVFFFSFKIIWLHGVQE